MIRSAGDSRRSPTPGLYDTPKIPMREPRTAFAWSFSARAIRSTQKYGIALVDLTGELDELGLHVELARPPGEVEGVHRQAVAAHARARA